MLSLMGLWKGRRISKTLSSYKDTPQERERWFQQCLDEMGKWDSYQNLAFLYKIGCGLGGGNWDHYLPMIKNFAVTYIKTCDSVISHNGPNRNPQVLKNYMNFLKKVF